MNIPVAVVRLVILVSFPHESGFSRNQYLRFVAEVCLIFGQAMQLVYEAVYTFIGVMITSTTYTAWNSGVSILRMTGN